MKHLLLALSVPLALAMGCGADSPDNLAGSGGAGLDNDGNGGTDVTQSGLVLAKVPNNLVGDFYFGGTLTCEGASSCEASVAGSIKVEFKCPKHLFLPKTTYVNGKDVTIVWDKPGDWGLAPQGTYRDQADQYEGEATTKVMGDHIELHWDGAVLGTVKGSSFAGVDGIITYSNGVISGDLKTISYHAFNGEKQWDAVLILVE